MRIHGYAQAEAFLNGFINYEKLLGGVVTYDTKSFDLDNFRQLLASLGDPQRRYSVIHVAGTKGKGSTCAFLHSVLRAQGIKTGLYTSPHVASYRERIAVDGQPIPEERFCQILSQLADRAADLQGTQSPNFRTVFELLTATAFVYFAEQDVQVAVIETGLGGRLDSTNVFDLPPLSPARALVNVITPIGLDHTAILGDTIDKIAGEKAGILRPHATVVLAPQPASWAQTVETVVKERIEQIGGSSSLIEAARLLQVDSLHEDAEIHPGVYGEIVGRFSFSSGTASPFEPTQGSALAQALSVGLELTSHLLGVHQLDNLRTVLSVLLALEQRTGTSFSPQKVAQGVEETRWPGRFEILCKEPLVIVDGAHCMLSAAALAKTFRQLFGDTKVVAVTGFMRDKAAQGMFHVIRESMNVVGVVACQPPSPRALEAEKTAELARSVLDVPVEVVRPPEEAFERALSLRENDQAIVAFGSMFLIAPVKRGILKLG